MSRYGSRRELEDVIRSTVATDYNNLGLPLGIENYNLAGILRDARISGGGGSGWYSGADSTEFTASLRRHVRPAALEPGADVAFGFDGRLADDIAELADGESLRLPDGGVVTHNVGSRQLRVDPPPALAGSGSYIGEADLRQTARSIARRHRVRLAPTVKQETAAARQAVYDAGGWTSTAAHYYGWQKAVKRYASTPEGNERVRAELEDARADLAAAPAGDSPDLMVPKLEEFVRNLEAVLDEADRAAGAPAGERERDALEACAQRYGISSGYWTVAALNYAATDVGSADLSSRAEAARDASERVLLEAVLEASAARATGTDDDVRAIYTRRTGTGGILGAAWLPAAVAVAATSTGPHDLHALLGVSVGLADLEQARLDDARRLGTDTPLLRPREYLTASMAADPAEVLDVAAEEVRADRVTKGDLVREFGGLDYIEVKSIRHLRGGELRFTGTNGATVEADQDSAVLRVRQVAAEQRRAALAPQELRPAPEPNLEPSDVEAQPLGMWR